MDVIICTKPSIYAHHVTAGCHFIYVKCYLLISPSHLCLPESPFFPAHIFLSVRKKKTFFFCIKLFQEECQTCSKATERVTLPTSVSRCSPSSQRPYARSIPPTKATDWSITTIFSWCAHRYTEEETWSGWRIT